METIITESQYKEALNICHKYQQQINGQIAEVEGTRIKDFIEANKKRISKRLSNVLYKASEKYTYLSDLNEKTLMSVDNCGKTSLQEFKELLITVKLNQHGNT